VVEQLTQDAASFHLSPCRACRSAIRVCWIASWQSMILATMDGCGVAK
jgi:hypothetical protein